MTKYGKSYSQESRPYIMPILLDTALISHSPEQTGHQISQIKWTFELFCAFVGNFAHFFCFSFWAIFALRTLTKKPPPSMQAIFFMKGELFEAKFLISFVLNTLQFPLYYFVKK